jgi:hypothetical protein
MNLQQTIHRAPYVLSQAVVDETVLLDLRDESLYRLDGAGARLWELIGRTDRLADVVESLLSEYEVERAALLADLEPLLDETSRRGLIELTPVG